MLGRRALLGLVIVCVSAAGLHAEEPAIDGRLDADPSRSHELLVNARVIGDPEQISRVMDEAFSSLPARVTIMRREAFRPAEPRPERRA